MNNKSTGQYGESLAASYLKKKGYSILTRNFACRAGEIDIIAKKGRLITFIEVKTRYSLKFGLPCESVTSTKQEHLRKTAECYIAANSRLYSSKDYFEMRLDVIEILINNGKPYVNHIENIW